MVFELKISPSLNRRIHQCCYSGLFVLLMMQLAGCSWFLSQRIQLPIVPNAAGMSDVQVTQSVSVSRSNHNDHVASEQNIAKQFIVVTTIQNGRFQVVGVTTLGQRLFTVKSDGEAVQVERNPGLPDSVPLQQLLALIQLVYWPDEVLAERYGKSWQLFQSPGSKSASKNQQLVVQARFPEVSPSWNAKINIEHFPADMMIEITPIEVKYL